MAITTKKEFKNEVQNHIIHMLSTENTEVLKEQLQEVMNEFTSWYTKYEQKIQPNTQMAFIDWLWGLPSCLSIDYWDEAIENHYNNWFLNIGIQPRKLKMEDVRKYYMHFLTREFITLCKKNGVNFYV